MLHFVRFTTFFKLALLGLGVRSAEGARPGVLTGW
jgi:hypothetical protein